MINLACMHAEKNLVAVSLTCLIGSCSTRDISITHLNGLPNTNPYIAWLHMSLGIRSALSDIQSFHPLVLSISTFFSLFLLVSISITSPISEILLRDPFNHQVLKGHGFTEGDCDGCPCGIRLCKGGPEPLEKAVPSGRPETLLRCLKVTRSGRV